jgi:hypothetical protein
MKRILFLSLFLVLPSLARAQEPIDRRISQIREKMGDSYRLRRDEQRKIAILSDLPEKDIDGYLQDLRVYEDALHATFFERLPNYWILVVIPSSSDDYNRKLGGHSSDAGFYDFGTQTLTVNITTGDGTMIHEWTHALNAADQSARGQSQPSWILEGFGSLYEQVGIYGGRPVGFTNWRLPQIQSMIQSGSVRPMRDFIINSKKYFDQDAAALRRWLFRGCWKTFTMSLAFGDIHPRPTIGVQLDAAGGRLRITKVVSQKDWRRNHTQSDPRRSGTGDENYTAITAAGFSLMPLSFCFVLPLLLPHALLLVDPSGNR